MPLSSRFSSFDCFHSRFTHDLHVKEISSRNKQQMSNNNNNNTITLSSNTSEIPVIVYICIHLVMPCAVAIGVIGNLLSILVFARREMIKFCVSILTIVLALSDILFLTTALFNIVLPDFLGGLLSDKSAFWW